jgi:hypothetical protein
VALARKLADVLFAMWRDSTVFTASPPQHDNVVATAAA